MRRYIVETKDGDWNITNATPLSERMRRAPSVSNGLIHLDGKVYVVDPTKFRRIPYKPRRYLGFVTEYMQVQMWKENDPEPVPFLAENSGAPNISGDVIAQYAKSEHLRRLVQPETNWLFFALILSIVVNLAFIGVVYSLSQ